MTFCPVARVDIFNSIFLKRDEIMTRGPGKPVIKDEQEPDMCSDESGRRCPGLPAAEHNSPRRRLAE